MFNIDALIKDKVNNKEHNASEIDYIVNSYLNNKISNQDMTHWLKAIFNYDMNIKETIAYTSSIINSGKKIKFNNLNGYIVDKHSTGGVGDKVSMILGPILAACGCYVPMIVGRHLEHTGGTLDKLESIPNFHTSLSMDTFHKQIKSIGCTIASQSENICPADKILYATRDLTGTVPSLPLICSSIMSKKIAEDLDGLVIDLKVGSGTFMKTLKENFDKMIHAKSAIAELDKLGEQSLKEKKDKK